MMDETPAERIVTRLTELVMALALVWLAKAVPDSLPFVTGTLGAIVGRAAGATIATRVRSNTARKLGGGGPHGGAGGGTSSDVPPPGASGSPPSMSARLVEGLALSLGAIALALIVVAACAPAPVTATRPPTPLEAAYAAELLHCVDTSPTYLASKACRSDVDAIFAPLLDGGAAAPVRDAADVAQLRDVEQLGDVAHEGAP